MQKARMLIKMWLIKARYRRLQLRITGVTVEAMCIIHWQKIHFAHILQLCRGLRLKVAG